MIEISVGLIAIVLVLCYIFLVPYWFMEIVQLKYPSFSYDSALIGWHLGSVILTLSYFAGKAILQHLY